MTSPSKVSVSPALRELEYEQLCQRVREIAVRVTSRRAKVLVVSKGDRQLLRLQGREGWHFPQVENGVYAASYPADSAEAIDHLEALRQRGAEYLLLPRTAFWWLEFYPELRSHLEDQYGAALHHDETCIIFPLRARKRRHSRPGIRRSPEGVRRLQQRLWVRQIRALVAHLLPAAATVLVAHDGNEDLLALEGMRTRPFRQTEDGTYAGHHPANGAEAVAHLEALRQKGAEYLLLPSTAFWWLEHYPELRDHLDERCRLLARQQHCCLIVDLHPQGSACRQPASPPAWASL